MIIPNFNGEALLGACLASLLAQSRRPDQVIVVDNGSADRSRRIIEAHPLKPELVVLEKNYGFAAAMNRGIERAQTEAVALLNNDAVADADWIKAGLEAMERWPKVSMFASLMLDFQERTRLDSAGDIYGRDGRPRPRGRGEEMDGFQESVEVFSACAGAGFFRKALLEELGGFEESFFAYLEDIDLGFRARARGHTCLFVPEARVYHLGAATDLQDRKGPKPVDSSERVFLIAKNRVRVIARNWPTALLWRFSFRLMLGFIRSASYHLLVSRQAVPFFKGLLEGARLFGKDRASVSLQESSPEYARVARLMREGWLEWPN